MKYSIIYTNTFKKQLRKLAKSGKFSTGDKASFGQVINLLAKGQKLNPKYRDHKLKNYQGEMREFHFKPDLLVKYELVEDVLILSLEEISNHNSMF